MKTELNNIVVEVMNKEHGKEVIKTFKELGVNTGYNEGNNTKQNQSNWRYYGVYNNKFNYITFEMTRNNNIKIIALDELKAMKQPKEDVYPKLMYVGVIESHLALKVKKEVLFCNENGFWARDNENKNIAKCYDFAQDIEPEAPIEKEVIDINIPNLENVIVTINGKEIQYK